MAGIYLLKNKHIVNTLDFMIQMHPSPAANKYLTSSTLNEKAWWSSSPENYTVNKKNAVPSEKVTAKEHGSSFRLV